MFCVLCKVYSVISRAPADSPLLLLSSTSTISLRRWLGVLFMAEWMERRMTDSASLTKMNTMLTCGRLEGYDMFLHLQRDRKALVRVFLTPCPTDAVFRVFSAPGEGCAILSRVTLFTRRKPDVRKNSLTPR